MPDRFIDRRKTKHYIVDHKVVDEYLPALGGNAFMLYSIYCRLASGFGTVFPSLKTIQQNTGFSRTSISKYNSLLEEVGLIKIERQVYSRSRKGPDDEELKFPSNESNTYILLEPEGLTPELKRKYYPKNWRPIIKYTPSPKYGQGVSGEASPNFGQGPGPNSGQALVQKMYTINKDLNAVVLKDKTTTEAVAKLAEAALPFCSLEYHHVVVGMEVILKTALKSKSSLEEAFQAIVDKTQMFAETLKKADNPLALLHAAVKHDWKDTGTLKKQEAIEFKQNMEREEAEQKKLIKEAWDKIPAREKAKFYQDGLRWDFHKRHKKQPQEEELRTMMDELIESGRYGIFDLAIPSPYFRPEEQS